MERNLHNELMRAHESIRAVTHEREAARRQVEDLRETQKRDHRLIGFLEEDLRKAKAEIAALTRAAELEP